MNEQEKKAREAHNRDMYLLRLPSSPTYVAAQAYFNRTLARLKTDRRVRPYVPETEQEQAAYLAEHYGNERPRGVGIRLGETITMDARQVTDATRFIATDSLQDCQGLVLVAKDADGKVIATQMSHFDRVTVIERAVPQLLAQMPQGSQIEATLLNGPLGFNYYMQADLLNALAQSARVSKIQYNFDAATTVGVDTTTGKILTASAPLKSPEQAYDVTHLPLDITLKPLANPVGMTFHTLAVHYFDRERPWPQFDLVNIYTPGEGFHEEDDVTRFITTRQNNDGMLDAGELAEIAKTIGEKLHTRVTLEYQTAQDGLTTIDIITAKGAKLVPFYSLKLDPALGNSGTIDPANTPLVVDRAPATDTMSPPTGRAPTGRQ